MGLGCDRVLLCCCAGLLLAVSSAPASHAARILAVAPTYAVSHFKMIQPLLLNLAKRGHEITAITFYPQSEKLPNYTDIDLRRVIEPYNLTFEFWGLLHDIYELFTVPNDGCNEVFSSEPVQNLLKSGQKFDLIIAESFVCESILGFPAFYNAPYITFSPMALPPWLADWVWNPVESSYVPDHICRETDSTSLLDRGRRVLCQAVCRLASWFYVTRQSVDTVNEIFNTSLSSIDDIKSNVSAMFVNTIPALGGVRPYLPNVVEIGGIHLLPPKILPKDLAAWLDKCVTGVVVFSMGSMVQASTLKAQTRNLIIDILGSLDQCVLWKWEEKIENLPKNIRTIPWLPQADVLAHRNVKLFVAHGGFHGLYEAIYNGIPVVGIPLYGDQPTNLRMLENAGSAVVTSIEPFSPSHFKDSIHKVLHNSSYGDNMRRLSNIIRDVPHTPLETALWWTEHVLRHNGAPHWRHHGTSLTVWQFYYLDIIVPAAILIYISSRMLNYLAYKPNIKNC